MPHPRIKRALISVYDKTGIVEFAQALVSEFGIEVISTGGTAKLLKEAGLPVTLVEEVTGFPEMMDGRVKTLHPRIHAAILADRDNPEHMGQLKEQGIEPIDMVVVNLYPFEKTISKPDCTFEQAIEMIDIGGPCLLRAAAKNHKHVLPIMSSVDYDDTLEMLRKTLQITWEEYRILMANKTFPTVYRYDLEIGQWFDREVYPRGPTCGVLDYLDWGPIRYGENPHQTADMWSITPDLSLDLAASDYVGDEDWQTRVSFNNYVDADAGQTLCGELSRGMRHAFAHPKIPRARVDADAGRNDDSSTGPHCVCFIKHTNACGVGVAHEPNDAYRRAYLGDPSAAMGGILACTFDINAPFAEAVMNTFVSLGKPAGVGSFFLEVWIAPTFEEDAIKIVRSAKKWGKRVRLLELPGMSNPPDDDQLEYRWITGGMLVQQRDLVGLNEEQWKVVTERKPTDKEMADLRLAWLICKHTKSNAITICKENMLIGNGAGQMSRVMSCRIATWLAQENGHSEKLRGAAAASDAFFPFRDGPDILMDAGVTAIIQPGGSKRDEDTITACNERNVAMIFTGTRHFKH